MSSFRLFRLLHGRQLTKQPTRVLLAVAALGAGVGISVGCLLFLHSLDASIGDAFRDLTGTESMVIVGPFDRGGLSVDVPAKAASVDGVREVVPAVSAVAVAERSDGRELYFIAVGVDCRIEAVMGEFGCDATSFRPVRRNAPVIMSARLARELGSGAVMRSDVERVRLDGVTVNDSLDDTNNGRVAFFELSTAQRLFGRPDRVDVAFVAREPGVTVGDLAPRLQDAVGDWNTVVRPGGVPPYMGLNGPLTPLLLLAVLLALGLSGVLVYNIVSLSLAERRRDLAVASAVGTSSRRLISGILAESAMLGLASGVIGALVGVGFAYALTGTISAVLIEQSIGIPLTVHLGPRPLITGIVLGVITAIVASWVPARRVRKIQTAAELHGRAVHVESAPRRSAVRTVVLVAVTGAAVLVSHLAQRGGGIEPWQSRVGMLAVIVVGASTMAVAGSAAPLVLLAVLRRLSTMRGSLRLAVSNLVTNSRRTSVMAASVGAAVGMACVIGAIVPAIRAATGGALADIGGRVFVSTVPMNNAGASARPSEKDLATIARLPGVDRIEHHRCVNIGDRSIGLSVCTLAFAGGPPFTKVLGDVSSAALERGDAIVGTSVARSNGVRPGSRLRLPTPDGYRHVRVAGVWRTPNDNGYRVSVSPRTFLSLFGPERAEQVAVVPQAGVTPAEVVRQIEAADLDPDLYALTPVQAAEQLADEVGDQVTPFWTLQRMLLFVALVATLSTLLLVGVQRRRELGVLGATGFSPVALARMTISEALAAGLVGAVLGFIGSFASFEVIRNIAGVSIGASPPWAFDPKSPVVATLLALVVVTVGALLPAWRTSRLQIVEAIRDE